MKKLTEYFKLQKDIYEYFGYKEDWVAIPIDDCREDFWKIIGDEKTGSVRFAKTMEKFNSDGNYYEDDIYTQRFLPKWVYRGKEYTMVCSDPHTDGNKFLRIFDNAKEVK